MQLAVNNPNLSVILPVGCNASCDFCYWEKDQGLTPEVFKHVASTLPEMFKQVSITGGETTLSPDLTNYLIIAKQHFNKVVLNTNGHKLTKKHVELADYVNISRHHWDDTENNKIFKTTSVPSTIQLKRLATYGDITLNCVLPDGFSDQQFIDSYIKYAKSANCKVAFRKYFNNLEKLPIDTNDTLNWEHSCPACLHRNHTINGVDVTYKYSVQETSKAINGIYELVLQANGDLTIDWAGKQKLTYKE